MAKKSDLTEEEETEEEEEEEEEKKKLAALFKTELPPVQLPPTVAAATEAQVLAKVAATLPQEEGENSTSTGGKGSDDAKS